MLSNGFSSIKMRSVGEQKKLHISKFSETKKYSQKSLVSLRLEGIFSPGSSLDLLQNKRTEWRYKG